MELWEQGCLTGAVAGRRASTARTAATQEGKGEHKYPASHSPALCLPAVAPVGQIQEEAQRQAVHGGQWLSPRTHSRARSIESGSGKTDGDHGYMDQEESHEF